MYEKEIKEASEKYGVNEKLIKAVIKTESNGDANKLSDSGAIGLMQISPNTVASMGVKNPYDAKENIEAGTGYLGALIENNNGDIDKSLRDYNSGYASVNGNLSDDDYVKSVYDNMKESEKEETVTTETLEEKRQNNLNLFGDILVVVLCVLCVGLGIWLLIKAINGNVSPIKSVTNKVMKGVKKHVTNE